MKTRSFASPRTTSVIWLCPPLDSECTKGGHTLFCLKREPQRKLHHARVTGKRRDLSRRAAGDVRAGLSKFRRIAYVEDLPASLNVEALDGNFAQQCCVKDVDVRADECVASAVAELAGWRRCVGVRQV